MTEAPQRLYLSAPERLTDPASREAWQKAMLSAIAIAEKRKSAQLYEYMLHALAALGFAFQNDDEILKGKAQCSKSVEHVTHVYDYAGARSLQLHHPYHR